ncbi:MAG: hypothetical protein WCP09_01280 [Candidatus Taylorbacteria bacterium]
MKRPSLPQSQDLPIISRDQLHDLYITCRQSVSAIAILLKCSQNRINYWLAKYHIPKRTISEAIYQLRNPKGDPFLYKPPDSLETAVLFGMGLGLYWGEGSKRGTGGVRLTNTDPRLLRKFIEFLQVSFNIDRFKLRFGLQIFDDLSKVKTLSYWTRELGVSRKQFYKIIVSKIRGKGTYKIKSANGVIIVYFNNIKLKRQICAMIDNIR